MTRRLYPLALTLLALLLGRASAQATADPSPSLPPKVPAKAPAKVVVPKVLARYPHAADAFTEGLEFSGGVLFESTGLQGQSSLRRVNLMTGEVLLRRAPPSSTVFAEGLTLLNGALYQLTWQDGLAYLYDPQTLSSLGQLRYSGEGWGLTNDGKQLVMSNGSDTLVWRDPRTFAIKKQLRVTDAGRSITNLNELEYAGGSLYANIWLTNQIAKIDPQSGKVSAWLDISALAREAQSVAAKQGRELGFDDVPNGIAYNAAKGTLLLTGKHWPLVFEVSVPGLGKS